MGCDIHLVTEAKIEGKWQRVLVMCGCDWCDGKKASARGEDCYGCKGTGRREGYDSRNYEAFAILAGVRGDATAISPPRGLPKDLSVVDRDDEDDDAAVWLGDHSYSYLGLDELMRFNWAQPHTKRGYVDLETFAEWKASGERWPSSWCGAVSGGQVVHVSNERMAELVAMPAALRPSGLFYTLVEWTDTYAACAGDFHSTFLPALVALGHEPENVRIVFGFDS